MARRNTHPGRGDLPPNVRFGFAVCSKGIPPVADSGGGRGSKAESCNTHHGRGDLPPDARFAYTVCSKGIPPVAVSGGGRGEQSSKMQHPPGRGNLPPDVRFGYPVYSEGIPPVADSGGGRGDQSSNMQHPPWPSRLAAECALWVYRLRGRKPVAARRVAQFVLKAFHRLQIQAGAGGSKAVRCKALEGVGLLIEALGRVHGEDILAYLLPGLVGGLGRELLVTGYHTFLCIKERIIFYYF
jgi:hypothetical protein